MPPRTRKSAKQELEEFGELCAEHFPHGWSHVPPGQAGVGCEHGEWARPADAEPPTPTPEEQTDPAAASGE